MRLLTTKTRLASCIVYSALCILLVSLAACGSGSDSSDGASSDTGSIAFSVAWQGAAIQNPALKAATLSDDCTNLGVDTVEATVCDQDDTPLKSGGPWACDVGSGTIKGVPAGDTRKVVILGMDSNGDVMYRGEKSGITVTAGQTNHAGTITMNYVGDTLVWDISNWDEGNWG